MFSVRRIASAAAVLVLAAGTSALAVPAHAATVLVACTGGSLDVYVNEAGGDTVTGSGTLTGCTSAGVPGITSGTFTLSGNATVNTTLEEVTLTTDTITWNTGATTTVSEARTFTFTSVVGVAETGSGVDFAGLFSPSDENEVATGTETTAPGVGKGFDVDFTVYDEVTA